MSFLKKAVAAILAMSMLLISAVSCNQSATKVIFSVDGQDVPSGIYLIYLLTATGELENKIDEAEYEGDKWAFEVDGVAAEQWIKDRALELTFQLVAVEKMFNEQGLSFTNDEKTNLSYYNEYYWNYYYKNFYSEIGVAFESFERVQKVSSMGQKIILSQYGEDGTNPTTDEEIKTYMNEHYCRVNHILISNKDDDKVDLEGDALAEAEENAKIVLDRAKDADDAAFIELIKELSADYHSDSTTDASLALGMIFEDDSKQYVEEFVECSKNLAIGGTDMCKSTYGWHIIRRYDMFGDGEVELSNYRTEAIISMKEDEYEASRDAKVAELREKATVVEASVKRYNPKDKKFE